MQGHFLAVWSEDSRHDFFTWIKNSLKIGDRCHRKQGRSLAGDSLLPRARDGLPCGSASKEFTYNAGDLGSIPGLERSPGEGKGYPLQYSGLEISIDYTVHGVTKSRTPLSNFHFPSWERVGANAKGTAAQSMAKGTTWPNGTNTKYLFLSFQATFT